MIWNHKDIMGAVWRCFLVCLNMQQLRILKCFIFQKLLGLLNFPNEEMLRVLTVLIYFLSICIIFFNIISLVTKCLFLILWVVSIHTYLSNTALVGMPIYIQFSSCEIKPSELYLSMCLHKHDGIKELCESYRWKISWNSC